MNTYKVYRNGEVIAEGLSEKSYTDTNLTPNTDYEYQVSSVNDIGESELSEPITITTDYSDPTSVDVSPKINNLTIGANRTLTAVVSPSTARQTVTWSSSDDAIVTVTNGEVTAVAPGTVTITVTSTEDNSITGTATVNVTEPTEG